MTRRQIASAVFGVIFMFVMGCEPQVMPTTPGRQPLDPAQVKLYQKAPKQYEILGTVEVPVGGDVHWDQKGDATAGFDKLRAQAAAKGANGLLFTIEGTTEGVLAGDKGTYYKVPLRMGTPSVAVAQAIYVLKED